MAEEKKMIIDGVSCPFTTERNVLEVARNNGIDIPSLCYCETCPSTAAAACASSRTTVARWTPPAPCSRATAWS